jgi:hypothetical protein
MSSTPEKSVLTRLADAGEEAIQRLSGAPGGDRLVSAVNTLRDRMDEMQRRLRGVDELEKRLTSVEERLDKLEGTGSTSTSTTPRAKRSTSSSK